MPLTDHIALVSLTREISTRSLLQAGAAVQKQLTRDFTPIWGLRATLDTFEDLSSVPSDYHPVVLFAHSEELVGQLEVAIGPELVARLVDDFERDRLAGLHLNAFTRQPFALVEASDAWSVTISHEVLEMIADPYGNRLIAAAHPLDASAAREVPARGLRSLPGDLVPGQRRAGVRLLHAALLRPGRRSTAAGTASRARSSGRCRSSRAAI